MCLNCHGYDLIITSEGPTYIHHSTNSETTIQWCSLKYNRRLKSHPNVKVIETIGHCFVSNMGVFSITRFNNRLLTFARFVEFQISSAVKAGLNMFSDFPA